jgi:outer membrane protein W
VGVELQFRGWVMDRFSLGLGAEWSRFVDERSRTTFNVNNAAITASAYNHMQMTNARLLLHYYLMQGNVRPYIGPNVGLGWTWFETQAADLVLSDTQFSMNFGGEVGVLFGERPTVMANLRYTWVPAAEFLAQVDDIQTVSVLVGVGL